MDRCTGCCEGPLHDSDALSASTSNTASVLIEANTLRRACMAASHPDGCPAQTWDTPAARVISLLSTVIRDLPMIRLRTSPIPIGLTPGFLSRGISLLLRRGMSPAGSTCCEARCRATSATRHIDPLMRIRGGRTRFRGYVTITRILRVYCLCA